MRPVQTNPPPAGEHASVDELWKFIWARVPNVARNWKEEPTRDWLASSIRAGRALVIGGQASGPKAFAVIRPIMRPRQAKNFAATDPEGAILHLDVMAFADAPSFLALVDCAMRRFGTRPKLSFYHKGRQHVWPLQRGVSKALNRVVAIAEATSAAPRPTGNISTP